MQINTTIQDLNIFVLFGNISRGEKMFSKQGTIERVLKFLSFLVMQQFSVKKSRLVAEKFRLH